MTRRSRINLPIKVAYTAFIVVLVPYYWINYTPWNFLYFCDLALLMTLAALWTEDPLLASMPAVGILLPQLIWVADLISGARLTGMTAYMFNNKIPIFVRGLSSFHWWLPFLLLWSVWRLGYDRRALAGWAILTWIVLPICYFLAPVPPAPVSHPSAAVNINYVYGLSDEAPQHWMTSRSWFLILVVLYPLALNVPAHFGLLWLLPRRGTDRPAQAPPSP